MASPTAVSGVGSGLDVGALVDKLMAVEQKPITTLQQKEAAVTLKISAFGTFKGAVSALKGTLSGLEQTTAYNAVKASVSDSAVASASTTADADPGTHSLEVTKLAAAQRLKSGTFDKITSAVGTGSLTIDFGTYTKADDGTTSFAVNGDRPSKTITIGPGNNTLAGVRDAINKAGAGVTASIVNDGSGNRLVLSSNSTGAANSMRISVSGDADGDDTDTAGLSQLAFDQTKFPPPVDPNDPNATPPAVDPRAASQVTAGGDAEFLLDGLSIKKSSNTVSDVLQGTTLNLLKTNSGSPTTLTVAQDTSGIKKSVDDFVKAYNDVADSVKELTGYDAEAKKAGVLSGNSTIRSLASQMRSTLSSLVSNVPGGYNALAQVGVSFDADGKLTVNSSKLDNALTTNPKAVQGLFATGGNSEDSLVSYKTSSSTTPAGKYALNVTQLATQGQAVGSGVADLTIDDSNDALSVTINGVSTSVSLAHGTYNDASALAAEVQSKLNGSTALSNAKASVTVSQTDGVLSLTSSAYGSSSKVKLNGSSADSSLFGSASYTDGLDVAGSFNGVPATGTGQTLTAGNGLSVNILGGATGERGALTFTRGVAVQLDNLLTQALSSKGTIQSSTDGLQSQVKDMESQIAKMNDANAAKQERYTQQFNTLDGLLTNMQSQMSYLTQQLASLNSSK